jgi:tripartite-type tricarboxylate transporter receptor subunit TctC
MLGLTSRRAFEVRRQQSLMRTYCLRRLHSLSAYSRWQRSDARRSRQNGIGRPMAYILPKEIDNNSRDVSWQEMLVMNLRKIAYAVLACALATHALGVGTAQSASPYPTRPIKIFVPYVAGGTGDVVARVLGEKTGAELGQPMIIDNRPSANGASAAQAVARSDPDGYTLLNLVPAHIIIPSLQRDVPYDWERDFTPVFGAAMVPLAFAVRAKSNIRSFADLVATAKSMSGGINYGSGGIGSTSHLALARLTGELKISATHVPYRGFRGAVEALLGDQVQIICTTIADVLELTKSGDFRILAVTSDKRLPYLPDVPTMIELGFADFNATSWNSYVAPTKTPSDVIDRLYSAYAKAAADPGVQDRLGNLGVTMKPMNGIELGKFLHEDSARWRRIIEENHITMENQTP